MNTLAAELQATTLSNAEKVELLEKLLIVDEAVEMFMDKMKENRNRPPKIFKNKSKNAYTEMQHTWLHKYEALSVCFGEKRIGVIDLYFQAMAKMYFIQNPDLIRNLLVEDLDKQQDISISFREEPFADIVAKLRIQSCCHIPHMHRVPLEDRYVQHIYKNIVAYIYIITMYQTRSIKDEEWNTWAMLPDSDTLKHMIRHLRLVSHTTKARKKKEKQLNAIKEKQSNKNYFTQRKERVRERLQRLERGEKVEELSDHDSSDEEWVKVDKESEGVGLSIYEMKDEIQLRNRKQYAAGETGISLELTQEQLAQHQKRALCTYSEADVEEKEEEDATNAGLLWNFQPADIFTGLLPLADGFFMHYYRDKYILDRFPSRPAYRVLPTFIDRFMNFVLDLDIPEEDRIDEDTDEFNDSYQTMFLESLIPMGAIFYKHRSQSTKMDRAKPTQMIQKWLGAETASRLEEIKDVPRWLLLEQKENSWLWPYYVAQKYNDKLEEYTRNNLEKDDLDKRSFRFLKTCYLSTNNPLTLEKRKEKIHPDSRYHQPLRYRNCMIFDLNRDFYVYSPVKHEMYSIEKNIEVNKRLIYAVAIAHLVTMIDNKGIVAYTGRTLKKHLNKKQFGPLITEEDEANHKKQGRVK